MMLKQSYEYVKLPTSNPRCVSAILTLGQPVIRTVAPDADTEHFVADVEPSFCTAIAWVKVLGSGLVTSTVLFA